MSLAEELPETSTSIPPIENGLEWPEHSPAVSMDIRLAGERRRIDFNITEYNELLDSEDVGAERSDLKIIVGIPGLTPEFSKWWRGRYVKDDKTMYIGGTDRDKNEVLIHETRHYLDHLAGNFITDRQIEKRQKISRIAASSGMVALCAPLIKFGIPEAVVVPIGFAGIQELLGLYLRAEYYARKEEIRARVYAREKNDKHLIIEDKAEGEMA